MIRVLAIDDDAAILKALRRWFAKFGGRDFVVITASDIDAEAAVSADPDAVLLDLTLRTKDGSSLSAGVDTVERAVQAWPHKPIIVLTGAYLNGLTSELRNAGAVAVLSKTDITSEDGFPELLTTLRDALRDKGYTRKAATVRTNISKMHTTSVAKRVTAYVLGGLGVIGGGGGAAAWQGCPGAPVAKPEVAAVEVYETVKHAEETTSQVRRELGDVQKVVDKIDKRVEDLTPAVYEIRGYLRAQKRNGE